MINTDTQDTDTKKDYCLDNERYNAIYQIKGTILVKHWGHIGLMLKKL